MRKVNGQHKRASKRDIDQPRLDVSAFRGQWVAIDPKTYKVVGHGPSLEAARQKTPNLDRCEPLLYFVPLSDAYFVGPAK